MTLKKINETATQKLMRDYGYQKKITEWMDAT